jgi:DNA-binding HxlR family transcriptional regulator
LILRDLHAGPARFTELQEGLGLASNLLSSRLRDLTDDGLVSRGAGQAYELTPLGRRTDRLLWELAQLGHEFDADPEPRPAGNLRNIALPLRIRLEDTDNRPELTALLDVDGEHFTIVSSPEHVDVLYNDDSLNADTTMQTSIKALLDFSSGNASPDAFQITDGHEQAAVLIDLLSRAFAVD